MGIFSGLFKSRDKPENRTAGSSCAFYLGGSFAGKLVTERNAMQMTAVYACVRILSEAIAGLPLHMYRYKGCWIFHIRYFILRLRHIFHRHSAAARN